MEQGNVRELLQKQLKELKQLNLLTQKRALLNWKNMFTSQLLITKIKNRYIAILEYYQKSYKV